MFAIFTKALSQILSNWKVAVQISALWIICALAGTAYLYTVMDFVYPSYMPEFTSDFRVAISFLIAAIIAMIAASSMAVYWHRYILLGELPKRAWLPSFQKLTFAYIWVLINMTLVVVICSIPVALFSATIATKIKDANASISILAGLTFLRNMIIYPYILRFSITLPAVAIGKPMTFPQALDSTKPIFKEIIAAVFLILALSAAFDYFIDSLLPSLLIISAPLALSIIGTGLYLLVSWISFIFGIGIVTVIYGHAVEKREL